MIISMNTPGPGECFCRHSLLLALMLLLLPLSQLPLAVPTTPSPTDQKAAASLTAPHQQPAIAFSALIGGSSCPTNVRPPDCAHGFHLTLADPRQSGCPLLRCEAGQETSTASRDDAPPTNFGIGCPSSHLPDTCPGSQVLKTVLEPRPGAPQGWCQSRRCACPELDDAAAACIADNRTMAVLAVEKSTDCRLLVECRLRHRRRCPPPPVCGPDSTPERHIWNSTDCPVYSCPMAAGNSSELAACPLTAPTCPAGSVGVIVDANDIANASGCSQSHQILCEPLRVPQTPSPMPQTPICPPEPAVECPPGELAVPLISTGVALATRCRPRAACLAIRVPPWLPVCPGEPRLCGGDGGGLRTELSVTDFGVLCIRVVCQQPQDEDDEAKFPY